MMKVDTEQQKRRLEIAQNKALRGTALEKLLADVILELGDIRHLMETSIRKLLEYRGD